MQLDHLDYKTNVYLCLRKDSSGTVEGDVDAVKLHTECRLGRWYYEGEGKQRYSKSLAYSKLEQPHIAVHEAGKAALEAFDNADEHAMLKNLMTMEQSSVEIFDLLNELDQEIASQEYVVAAEDRGDVDLF